MSLSTMGAGGGARWFVGAAVAIDFANGWSLDGSAPSSLITTTRASTAWAPNAAGVYTSFTSNVPRITDLGLLVEESRTNSIRNNSMQGAVAGTPGTMPTNWGITEPLAGLNRTIKSITTINGVDVIVLNFAGTANSTLNNAINLETTTQIVAASGQTWTSSVFLSLVVNSGTTPVNNRLRVSGRDAGGVGVETLDGPNLSLTSTLTRYSFSPVFSVGTVAYALPTIIVPTVNGSAYNFDLTIGWPQLELGAFATSPIRTTSAAATRAADLVTLTTVPVSGGTWTAFVDATSPTTAGKSTYFLAAGNNDLIIYSSTAAQTRVSAFNGTSTLNATAGSGNWSTGIKAAVSADGSGRSAVGNNGTVGTDANTQTFPAALAIGSRSISTTEGVITTRRIALWPVRLADAQMQALTA